MKLEDFLVMIGLKLLVKGNLENNLRYTTPFKNSENPVMTQALIYLSACVWFMVISPPKMSPPRSLLATT